LALAGRWFGLAAVVVFFGVAGFFGWVVFFGAGARAVAARRAVAVVTAVSLLMAFLKRTQEAGTGCGPTLNELLNALEVLDGDGSHGGRAGGRGQHDGPSDWPKGP